MAQNNTVQIKHVIQTLSQEFALSQHPHSRKGGLIGLAACSIALGKVCLYPEGTHRPAVASTLPLTPAGGRRCMFSVAILCIPRVSMAGYATSLPYSWVQPLTLEVGLQSAFEPSPESKV